MTPAEQTLILLLLADVERLAPLYEWPPAGNLADDVLGAARGHGGLSVSEGRRIQRWARQWSRLDSRLQSFYRYYAGHPAVSSVLWHLLDGRPRPEARTMGAIYALWEEYRGFRGSLVLVPELG